MLLLQTGHNARLVWNKIAAKAKDVWSTGLAIFSTALILREAYQRKRDSHRYGKDHSSTLHL